MKSSYSRTASYVACASFAALACSSNATDGAATQGSGGMSVAGSSASLSGGPSGGGVTHSPGGSSASGGMGGASAGSGGISTGTAGVAGVSAGSGGMNSGAGGAAGANGGSGGLGTTGKTARQKVLDYLNGLSGQKTIAGQHNKNVGTPTDATDWIKNDTGKTPGLWSSDFLFGQDALDNRAKMIAAGIAQWNAGAVVQLMYHNCIPTRDETCGWDDIGGAHPQHLTDDQWNQLLTAGTDLNRAWLARLDGLSVYFKTLKDAGVAPLFRPFHEMNQPIFWWAGRKGASGTLKLFQITHDYLVKTKGFDNIIWVWDIQDFGSLSSDVKDYNPGADYYDIAALDVYDGGYTTSNYEAMLGAAPGKLVAIGECEHLPTSNELTQQPKWAFFMLWPDFLDENASILQALYKAPNVVTQDQMPGWK